MRKYLPQVKAESTIERYDPETKTTTRRHHDYITGRTTERNVENTDFGSSSRRSNSSWDKRDDLFPHFDSPKYGENFPEYDYQSPNSGYGSRGPNSISRNWRLLQQERERSRQMEERIAQAERETYERRLSEQRARELGQRMGTQRAINRFISRDPRI
jgi:hypothetical protein